MGIALDSPLCEQDVFLKVERVDALLVVDGPTPVADPDAPGARPLEVTGCVEPGLAKTLHRSGSR